MTLPEALGVPANFAAAFSLSVLILCSIGLYRVLYLAFQAVSWILGVKQNDL
jgi:hypothetical protein